MKIVVPLAVLLIGAILSVGLRRPENPPVVEARTIETALRPPARVVQILRNSCYDCHSNTTRWPWYTWLPGFRQMVAGDVQDARATMNFSEWTTGVGKNPDDAASFLMAACADLKSRRMPLDRYLRLHPSAKPSQEEREAFCAWAQETARRVTAAAAPH